MTIQKQILDMAIDAKRAAREIAALSTAVKDRLLGLMADALIEKAEYIKKKIVKISKPVGKRACPLPCLTDWNCPIK